MTLKENAKTAFAKVLSDLIQSDGIVNQGEISYLRQVFKTLKINDINLKKTSTLSLAEAVAILKNCGTPEKAAILHVIQQLSISDDSIDPSESLLITALTLSIGLGTNESTPLQTELVSIPNLSLDTRNTVIYVESSFNKKVNKAIISDHEAICQLLEKQGINFFYLPMVMRDIRKKRSVFRQMLSYIDPLLSLDQTQLIMHDLKAFDTASISKEIFLNHLNAKGFNLNYPAFLIKIESKSTSNFQDFLILNITNDDPLLTLRTFYKLNDTVLSIRPPQVSKKTQRYLELLTMPKTDVVKDELQYTGFHKIIVDTIVKRHSSDGLSRIRITEDGHLFLVDRNNAEVKIQTIGRALYILYIRHPEGISLTALNDFREELLKIYIAISDYSDTKKLCQTVDNLVDFVGSTINPLLSRIRKAFTSLLGDQAKDYLIEGNTGEIKTINLDRKLVIDELP